MYNKMFNINNIQIQVDQSAYSNRLHLSDKNDVIPENIIINFNKYYLEQAITALDLFPEIDTLSFSASISSDDVGAIINQSIIVRNQFRTICASFNNGYTGTQYKLDITSDVLKIKQSEVDAQSSREFTVRRKSPFHFATFGRCIDIDSSHVPDADLEQLIETVQTEPPYYYRGLLIDFFLLPEFCDGNSLDGIGIRFFHQPWPVKDANEFFDICELKKIPKSIAELILHAGMDGLDILTIAPNQQIVEGLTIYTDEVPQD